MLCRQKMICQQKNDMSTILDLSTENVDNVGYIDTNGMSTGMICRQYLIYMSTKMVMSTILDMSTENDMSIENDMSTILDMSTEINMWVEMLC